MAYNRNNYNIQNFDKMKQEAMNRARDMKNKADENINETKKNNNIINFKNNNIDNDIIEDNDINLNLNIEKDMDESSHENYQEKKQNKTSSKKSSFENQFGMNIPFLQNIVKQKLSKDNILILALVFVLIKEKNQADDNENKMIIFALLYIFF